MKNKNNTFHGLYLSPQKALEYGFVDEILK
jgi:ATP-dependent protease ClpP protease subunit